MEDLSESCAQKLIAAENWIELSEKRTRILIEALPVGVFITAKSGQIEAANPQCLSLFSCSYSDLKHRSVGDLFLLPLQKPFTVDDLNSAHTEPLELEALRFDGRRFPAEIIVRGFSAPKAEQVMIIVEDITMRHEVQRLKKEFVSMISHDLRTPLTSLQCFLSAISDGSYDDDVSHLKELARQSEQDATRLIAMITNLLNVDKIESGRLDLFLDAIAVSEIVKTSVQSLSALAKQRDVLVNTELPNSEIYVMADNDFIVQVLVNLLGNALKHSPRSQAVKIAVELCENNDPHEHNDPITQNSIKHPSVSSGAWTREKFNPKAQRANKSFVKITVSDNGPGIEEDFRKRIFNRFEQATISDSRVKGGSGLGLSISRAIVEQHGGTIGVKSAPGYGASFWFTLPQIDV